MTDEKTGSVPVGVGSKAPGFALPSRSGRTISLAEFAGRNEVLVYFYPKDDTPGCTKQACSLRDGFKDLSDAGVVVLGISRDDAASHAAFAEKYQLPFELLSDADHAVHESYGAWGLTGPSRIAFLVDKAGFVRLVFKSIDTSNFANDVLVAAGFRAAEPTAVQAAVAEMKERVAEVKAAVAEAVPAVKKAAQEAVAAFENKPAVKKAVADAKAAAGKVSAQAKKAVAEIEKKPAVKKAVREVKKAAKKAGASAKKAIADARKKPAVKKAEKAVRSAVAKLKKKAAPKKKAVARKPAKKAAPKKAAPKKKVAPKKAVARKPAKKAVRKAVKKAARGRKR